LLQALIDEEPAHAPKRAWLPLAAAACLAVLAAASTVGYFQFFKDAYSAPVGGLVSVPMKDGSRITLNTDSKVRVAVTDKERMVQLERGEAFFEVAKDPGRPFVVAAGTQRIVAVGTEFSVRCDGADIRVIVTEGKVRLKGGAILGAGGVARSGGTGMQVQSKPLSEIQESLSWRQGFVSFHNAVLAEAVAEFNRYSEKKIEVRDAFAGGHPVERKVQVYEYRGFRPPSGGRLPH